MSGQLAPVSCATSGIPCASVRRWCLLPALRRSVGFGPVFFPVAARGPTRCRRPRAPDRAGHAGGVRTTAPCAAAARRRPAAIVRTGANRRCRTRSPFRSAAGSRAAPCARRRGCLSAPLGRESASGRHIDGCAAGVAAAAARSTPISHHRCEMWRSVTASCAVTRPYQDVRSSTSPNLATRS